MPTFALGRELVVIVSGAGEACTVSTVLPVTPDNVADMLGLPADTPVASPLPLGGVVIVATAAFDDAQATRFVIICLLLSE